MVWKRRVFRERKRGRQRERERERERKREREREKFIDNQIDVIKMTEGR
jgi:hypothetical protein